MNELNVAISSCPNDTFLFYGWLNRRIYSSFQINYQLLDIETLNELALSNYIGLVKVSFGVIPFLKDHYELLTVGNALGDHCGPKIIAPSLFPLSDLSTKIVAIPGKYTTAHLLLRLLCPLPKEKIFRPYHEMETLLQEKKVDAAVIIHENRFTFEEHGWVEIADLGTLWENQYKLLTPLGALLIHRDLRHKKAEITHLLKRSLTFAKTHPYAPEMLNWIQMHSQEKDLDVIKRHIDLYVNQETQELSATAHLAIEKILTLSQRCPV